MLRFLLGVIVGLVGALLLFSSLIECLEEEEEEVYVPR